MLQKEKQKNNKIFFQCHRVPDEFKNELKKFLDSLEQDDIFFKELKKITPQLISFEINFLTSNEIKKLNLGYRNIDSPTDVLSFNLGYIGEIDLCLDEIYLHSKDLNINFLEEVFRCIIHGCLHILGYDHKEKLNSTNIESEPMFLIQEEILKNVTPSNLS